MRTPIALGAVLAVVLSVLVGWLAAPWVGAVVLGLALLAGLVALYEAAHEPHQDGVTRHRVLVVAKEVLAGDELRELIGAGRQVEVLAPVLTSRTHLAVSDIDRECDRARECLHRSLDWLHAQGLQAHGQIGDPSTTTALEDALREFGAEEVIVVTHPREGETWQERSELERLRGELDLPVRHVSVHS